ncbi:hypothetical protein V1280_003458 [Bradyrhizobium sp. AZCC 2230]
MIKRRPSQLWASKIDESRLRLDFEVARNCYGCNVPPNRAAAHGAGRDRFSSRGR